MDVNIVPTPDKGSKTAAHAGAVDDGADRVADEGDESRIKTIERKGEAAKEGEGEATKEGEGEATKEGEGEATKEGEGVRFLTLAKAIMFPCPKTTIWMWRLSMQRL
jgi:hypothetical protein